MALTPSPQTSSGEPVEDGELDYQGQPRDRKRRAQEWRCHWPTSISTLPPQPHSAAKEAGSNSSETGKPFHFQVRGRLQLEMHTA